MSPPADLPADVGLLSPVSAGTAVEALTGDHAVVTAMVRAEVALLHALVETGIAPPSLDLTTLPDLTPDPRTLAIDAVAGGNPIIPLVGWLRTRLGPDTARWVHHGATSQDIVDTALMLIGADVARQIDADLTTAAELLAQLTVDTRSVPMAARTLSQPAMPTTLGMRACGWLAGIHDAVRALRDRLPLPASLGGPVGTAAAYGDAGPAVVDALAAGLGLRAPVRSWHTRRTPVIELATALTVVTGMCGKIAADVLAMAQIGEAHEGTAGRSSSMAHKANPVRSVLVASAARQAPALLAVLAASATAEQERPAGAWHSEWQPLRMLLRVAGGAAAHTVDLIQAARFDHAAMRRNLDLLSAVAGTGPDWVDPHLAHVDVWIDRVLSEHRRSRP